MVSRRDINLMERIQRLATRMIKSMRELPYEERLRRLNIFSLERRRLRGDLILAYNIFHGRLDLPHAEFFETPAERDLRGHGFKLRHRRFRLLRRRAAFSVRLPPRGINSRWQWSPRPHLTLSSDCWTWHGHPCSPPFFNSHACQLTFYMVFGA